MNRTEIRTLIRSVISEEINQVRQKKPESPVQKKEVVTIDNDQDLASFVKKLATLCKDETKRKQIETGQLIFTLDSSIERMARTSIVHGVENTARFEKGFINERQIDALSEETNVVVATKAVKFTPLAQDRLRQRGIRIERKAS